MLYFFKHIYIYIHLLSVLQVPNERTDGGAMFCLKTDVFEIDTLRLMIIPINKK